MFRWSSLKLCLWFWVTSSCDVRSGRLISESYYGIMNINEPPWLCSQSVLIIIHNSSSGRAHFQNAFLFLSTNPAGLWPVTSFIFMSQSFSVVARAVSGSSASATSHSGSRRQTAIMVKVREQIINTCIKLTSPLLFPCIYNWVTSERCTLLRNEDSIISSL